MVFDQGFQHPPRAYHIITLVHTGIGEESVASFGYGASRLIVFVRSNGIAITIDGQLEVSLGGIADDDTVVRGMPATPRVAVARKLQKTERQSEARQRFVDEMRTPVAVAYGRQPWRHQSVGRFREETGILPHGVAETEAQGRVHAII